MIFSGYLNVYNFQRVLLAARKAGTIASHCSFMHTFKKRLSYPYRRKDMVPLFGRNLTELHLIFPLDFVYQRHHHRLQLWNLYSLQPPYLQRYVNAVAGKDATLITVLTLLMEQLLVFLDLF